MSRSSFEVVSTTTGSVQVPGSALIRCSTSSPPTLGSLTSSRISDGSSGGLPSSGNSRASASSPSAATTTLLPMLFDFSARRVNTTSSGLSSTSKITPLSTQVLHWGGQGEVEGGAPVRLAVRPDPAAVPAQDALHDRQPEPAALEVGRRVQPLERVEQLVRVPHAEARPVVPDEVDLLAVGPVGPDRDPGRGPPAGELPRVGQQVLQHQPEQLRVAAAGQPLGDGHLDLPARVGGPQLGHDQPGQLGQVHRLPAQLDPGGPGQVQQVV